MRPPRFPIILITAFTLLVTLSCALGNRLQITYQTPATASVPPEFFTPTPGEPLSTEEAEAPSSEAPSESEPPSVSEEFAPCEKKVCIESGSFLLKRPIGPDGRFTIDTASRFGTLRRRLRDAYLGVQFLNSTGTPVLAAWDGDVVVAGDDSRISYGVRPNMYGNLVILRHFLPGIPEPVYTLYAHLSEVSVKAEGDVEAGEQIGLVGMTGSIFGSTLYFEVRYGENSPEAVRNPELWLELLPDETGDSMGALAGQVVDRQGNYVSLSNILVENLRSASQGLDRQIYLKTYIEKDLMGQSPWGETFAVSNLPEGTYQISFWYGAELYQRQVEVQPGMLTFVPFEVK